MRVPTSASAPAFLAAVALPLSLACSPGGPDEAKPSASAKPSPPTASAAPTPSAPPAALKAPKLGSDGVVAGRQDEIRGSGSFAFAEGRKGHALIVTVDCRGKGTLTVTVKPIGSEFSLECADGEVSSTQNVMDLSGAEKNGMISVQAAPSTVRWAATVGREKADAPGPDDPEATGTPEAE